MARDDGASKKGAPVENREVLLVADPIAHRLYYDATDGFAPGIRNYIASWAFDELEDGGCMMTISSNFDCVPAENGEYNRDMLQQIYVVIAESLDSLFGAEKRLKLLLANYSRAISQAALVWLLGIGTKFDHIMYLNDKCLICREKWPS